MSLALGMIFYAVPKLQMGQGWSAATVFGVVWIGMALVIVAAHLHEILGVDEETRQELQRIDRMKKWRIEQTLRGKSKLLQFRK
jgi:hypothetical protein